MIDLAVFDIAGTTVDEGDHVYRVLRQCVEDRGAVITDAQFRNWMAPKSGRPSRICWPLAASRPMWTSSTSIRLVHRRVGPGLP